MDRRTLLRSAALGAGAGLAAGCLGRGRPSGSGNPCERPRTVDSPAVEDRRDGGVYLENDADGVHTACVTVRGAGASKRDREESAPGNPPRKRVGYRIHPGIAVESFRAESPGRYAVTVRLAGSGATARATVERTAADADGATGATTFAITGPGSVVVRRTGESDSPTDWERSTDCEGEYDRMHDSVVSVVRVTGGVEDGYRPIEFSALTPGERAILRVVTEEGGYGTCTESDAFERFVDRVADRTARQDLGPRVFLERGGTYYGLYVESGDQVYAHG